MFDAATVGQIPDEGVRGFFVPVQAFVAPGDHQAVIDAFIDDALDGAFHIAEIEHHALVVQLPAQYHVGNPAFTYQAPGRVQIGEINHGEVVDKEMIHDRPG